MKICSLISIITRNNITVIVYNILVLNIFVITISGT